MVSAFTLPSITAAMRRGGVNIAADKLQQVIAEAQLRARRQVPDTPDLARCPLFGVAIVPDGSDSYATLLYGSKPSDEFISAGTPVLRIRLTSAVQVFAGFNDAEPAPLTTPIAWFFLPGSGRPVQAPAASGSTFPRPIGIGTPTQISVPADTYGMIQALAGVTNPNLEWGTRSVTLPMISGSPICSSLSLRSPDGRLRAGIAVYQLGVTVVSIHSVGASGAPSDAGG